MKVWLINPYGPIPGEGWRDFRFTILGTALAAEGHEVIWWTSSFSHHFKKQRVAGWTDRLIGERFMLRLVPTPSYSRNIGFGRVWRDLVFGWRAYCRGVKESKPDLVIFSESPLCLGFAGYHLARSHDSKMIFDQMDVWPELIENSLNSVARLLLLPFFWIIYGCRRKIYRRLNGALALASPYLDLMYRVAPQLRSRPSCVAYNGIDVIAFRRLLNAREANAFSHMKELGVIWAVFAGSLGETYDIQTILEVSLLLEKRHAKTRIIIAGDGPMRADVEAHSKLHPGGRLRYFGRLLPSQLIAVYQLCDIGLCAYSSRSNVEMPDKIYDYTAAGLAVLNSLPGEVAHFVENQKIGSQYEAGNAEAMANRILELETDPALLQTMRSNSLRLGETFDTSIQMRKVIELVNEVVL